MEKYAEQQQDVPPPGYTQQPGYHEQSVAGYGSPEQGFENPAQKGCGPPPNNLWDAPGHMQPGQCPQQLFQPSNDFVVTQQPGSFPVVAGPVPTDHMCAAIFVTLWCFWPTGIVAILRAMDARTALARGDIPAATAHARSARSMVIISVVIGSIALAIVAITLGLCLGLYFDLDTTSVRAVNSYGGRD